MQEMTTRKKTYEVFFASALGGATCWIIAVSLGAPHWTKVVVAILGAMAVAFVSYRPSEVIVKVSSVCREFFESLKVARRPKFISLQRLWVSVCRFGRGFRELLFLLLYFIIPIFGGAIVFSNMAVHVGISSFGEESPLAYRFLFPFFVLGIYGCIFAITTLALFGGILKHGNGSTFFVSRYSIMNLILGPFYRSRLWLGKRDEGRGEVQKTFFQSEVFTFLVMFLLVPLGTIGLLVVTIHLSIIGLDTLRAFLIALFNGLLALAVSERTSAMLGAFVGGLTCMFIYYGSTTVFAGPALVAMLAGGIAGVGIYRLRLLLIQRTGEPKLAY